MKRPRQLARPLARRPTGPAAWTSLYLMAAAALLLLPLLGAACTTQQPDRLPTPTFTLNPTQIAISGMLTETRAAPTGTDTPTATITPSPTATIEMPVTGSSKKPGAPGERIALGETVLTVLAINMPEMLGTLKPQSGHAYLDLEVLIENPSGEAVTYTPYYFALVDSQGRTSAPARSALFPNLLSGTLLPGEWVRGHVGFDLPANAAPTARPTRALPTKTATAVAQITATALASAFDLAHLSLSYQPQSAGASAAGAAAARKLPAVWVDLSQPVQPNAPLPSTPPNAGEIPTPGKRVEAGGLALTITQASASQRIQYTKAAPGNTLVNLGITLEDVNHPRTPYNPEYFIIRDDQGYEYQSIAVPLESILQPGSLKPGQKISSQVIFEVSAQAKHLVVKYKPQVLTDDYKEIRIGLEMPTP